MSWTINGQTLESLGITVAGWSESALTASELNLDVVQDFHHSTAAFSYDQTITLKHNGTQLFIGKVREIPRTADPSAEGLSYKILDAFDDLDRVVYHQSRESAVNIVYTDEYSIVQTAEYKLGNVVFSDNVTLGERIKKVAEYAIGQGVNLAIGNIDPGLKWFRAEYKDQSCGEIIRDMMRLMPEYSLWINNRTTPPTLNLRKRNSLPAVSHNLNAGNLIINHNITELESDDAKGVVLRYQIPITVDGDNHVFIIEDIAGQGEGLDVLVETVALNGANFQSEYAHVVTRPIPQPKAEDPDNYDENIALKWWIEQTPELASIADEHGLQELIDFLKIAETDVPVKNIYAHKLTVVEDGLDRPKSVNPNSEPLTTPEEQTDQIADYPRQLIEGTLPIWSNKKHRSVRSTATLGIIKDEFDAIQDKALKKRIKTLFSTPNKIDGTDYLTANVSAEIMATNAITKNYKRVVTADMHEPIPQGIAQDLLDQFQARRFTGSVTLKSDEVNLDADLGTAINFSGGASIWATMKEVIYSINYDIQTGEVSIDFGPEDYLSSNDMIDRLRAARRNSYTVNIEYDSDADSPDEDDRSTAGNKMVDGVGGTAATPVSKFNVDQAIVEHRCGLEIYGEISEDENLEIFIEPGHLVVGGSHKGSSLAYIMPEWNSQRLNADPRPSEQKSDGSYIVRLEYTTAKAEIKIEDASAETEYGPEKKSIPIAKFKIEGSEIKDLEQFLCGGVAADGFELGPYQPLIYDKNYGKLKEDGSPEDKEMIMIIGNGVVVSQDCNQGYFNKNVLGPDGGPMGPPYTENELGADGDTLYLNIQTDEYDVITSSEITTSWAQDPPEQTASAPPSDSSGTPGDYYIPVFSIHGDDDTGWYYKPILASAFTWKGVPKIENIGGGSRVYKGYEAESCKHELRTLVGKEVESSGSGSDGGGDESDVTITVVEEGDTIIISGKLESGKITGVECIDVETQQITTSEGGEFSLDKATLVIKRNGGPDLPFPCKVFIDGAGGTTVPPPPPSN